MVIITLARKEYVVDNLNSVLKSAGFEVEGCIEDAQLFSKLKSKPVNLLVMGGNIEPNSRMAIKALVQREYPEISVIEHFGGPATLLDEVKSAISI